MEKREEKASEIKTKTVRLYGWKESSCSFKNKFHILQTSITFFPAKYFGIFPLRGERDVDFLRKFFDPHGFITSALFINV